MDFPSARNCLMWNDGPYLGRPTLLTALAIPCTWALHEMGVSRKIYQTSGLRPRVAFYLDYSEVTILTWFSSRQSSQVFSKTEDRNLKHTH